MTDTGTAIIIASFSSLIGMMIILQMNNHNWFKRQNWKLQATQVKAENRLKMKKLEKELGLKGTSKTSGIDGATLKLLADKFLSGEEGDFEGEGGIGEMLINFAKDNPELVKNFLGGISKTTEDSNIDKGTEY